MEGHLGNNSFDSVPIGFFGGCIGLIIALVAGGPSTKSGSIAGFVCALALGGCLGFLSVALQIAAGSM